MIAILSHIVEFRNGESGLHVLHVQTLTDILLKNLVNMTDKYSLTPSEIEMISTASALHDIGKIAIPGEILNKPGRLTPEEFTVMKTHSAIGAEMLKDLSTYQNEPLIKFAHEICRWHHERFDGRGYPDGLKGDEIPISAQIVSLADVYDALTSERVYKKAFSHEQAMQMILNGECGTFNPLLLDCLKVCEENIKNELNVKSLTNRSGRVIKSLSDKVLSHDELTSSEHIIRMLEMERTKNDFTNNNAREIWFEYTAEPPVLTVSAYGAELFGIETIIIDPFDNTPLCSVISEEAHKKIADLINATTSQHPDASCDIDITVKGEVKRARIVCRTVWSGEDSTKYTAVIGKIEGLD